MPIGEGAGWAVRPDGRHGHDGVGALRVAAVCGALDRVLEQDFTTFKVSDVKVENADSLNKDLTTTYALDAERFGKTMGPLLMVRPRVLGSEHLTTDHKPRTVPIDLRETLQAKDDYDIELNW